MGAISVDVNSVQAWACTLRMSPAGQIMPRLPSHVLKSQLALQGTGYRQEDWFDSSSSRHTEGLQFSQPLLLTAAK